VLLTGLREGQMATVIQLPAIQDPHNADRKVPATAID
jgi:hypothetical protein